jgi:phosphoglycolate phosphatase-like HAD superfamily hydrolase
VLRSGMLRPNQDTSPRAVKSAKELAASLQEEPLGQQITQATGLVFDLDYTLVDSANGLKTLNQEIALRFGVVDFGPIQVMDDQMRGKPLEEYLPAFYQACSAFGRRPDWDYEKFLEVRKSVMADMSTGNVEIQGGVTAIPGAFELMTAVSHLSRKTLYVCTHCPRLLAKAFLLQSGFGNLVPEETLVCGDDTELGKDKPEYWKRVIPAGESSSWVGFDDTSHGARWMLEVAQIGTVIVRPSAEKYRPELTSLKEKYPERLTVVSDFKELFSA